MYDFAAVTERMDESVVGMNLLHNFPDESIVVSSWSKASVRNKLDYKIEINLLLIL